MCGHCIPATGLEFHTERLLYKLARKLHPLYRFLSLLFVSNYLGHLLFARRLTSTTKTDRVLTFGAGAFMRAEKIILVALSEEKREAVNRRHVVDAVHPQRQRLPGRVVETLPFFRRIVIGCARF